jgi:nucleotide-binding universal stress UspA family protein
VSEEAQAEMSIFSTRILMATDGSMDAELAAKVAMDLSKRTGAELLGSVSNKVLRAARGPVLVCPRRAPNGA